MCHLVWGGGNSRIISPTELQYFMVKLICRVSARTRAWKQTGIQVCLERK